MANATNRKSLLAGLIQNQGLVQAGAIFATVMVSLNVAGMTFLTCPFLYLTRLPCPACGLTRSCMSILRGDFGQSLRYHAMGPLLFGLGIAVLLVGFLPVEKRQHLAENVHKLDRKLLLSPLLIACFLTHGILRWF